MNILVLGGTRFFGKCAVKHMLVEGYQVTLVTRGQLQDEFGDKVKRITVDRTDQVALDKALGNKKYDVVFDNICYTPDDARAFLDLMKDRIGKYIVTSSLAVYSKGENLDEEVFDPYTYPIQGGKQEELSYAEGKRLVEAVVYQEYKVPAVVLRFPIVIGENDYTKRLTFYVKHTTEGITFLPSDYEEKMSFITEEEAGQIICKLIESNFVGPLNVASLGDITVKEVIEIIEELSGKTALIDSESKNIAPYSKFGGVTLNIDRAKKIGDYFVDIKEAFTEVIQYELDVCARDI